MRNAYDAVVKFGEHPLLASFLGAVILLTLGLGVLHELEIFGEVLLVLVRKVKRMLFGLKDVGGHLWRELTTWKVDD